MKLISFVTTFYPNNPKEDQFVGEATYLNEDTNKLHYKQIMTNQIIECEQFDLLKEKRIPAFEHNLI